MNRRTFLKSIATVCGVAVVCPGELLKESQSALSPYGIPYWLEGKNGSRIEGERIYMIYHPAFRSTVYTMHNFDGRHSGFIVTRPE